MNDPHCQNSQLNSNQSPRRNPNKGRNCLILLSQPRCLQQQSIKSHWAVCHWQTSVSSGCQWKLGANGAFCNGCSSIDNLSMLCRVCCIGAFFFFFITKWGTIRLLWRTQLGGNIGNVVNHVLLIDISWWSCIFQGGWGWPI